MPYLTDPKRWGPGVWFSIHLFAAKATDTEEKDFFVQFINTTVKNLPCLECRNHATKYLKRNPLISYMSSRDPKGLFRWSVDFHNHVNTRLRKRTVRFDAAVEMFYNDSGVCAGDCGGVHLKHTSAHTRRQQFRDW